MKQFNHKLKHELQRYEKIITAKVLPTPSRDGGADPEPRIESVRTRPVEKVVGGDILWKPVDRAAAMLLAKANWVFHPPPITSPPIEPEISRKPSSHKSKKKRTHMKGSITETGPTVIQHPFTAPDAYVSQAGIRVKMVNGEPMFDADDIDRIICDQIAKLPKETRPNVLAAQDARQIIRELLDGIGGEMEKFQANSKVYLEDIRQTRFAVVRECAEMTKELKDVRQFFLGPDYKEQITRLREFVELCERLRVLKECGFLDSVADTMIRLADK